MLELNFSPFPELKTERLLLRRITMDDVEELLFLRSDEEVLKYINKEPTTSIEDVKTFIEQINRNIDNNYSIMWGLALQEDPSRMIGLICHWRVQIENYRAEVGFSLHPQFWRKGLMKEALQKAIGYGFNVMGLHTIEGRINPDNKASAGILESVGFVREAYFREDYFFKGKFYDTAVYSLLKK
jgi:ribosomal-protein-alanine N-acetyltransferase